MQNIASQIAVSAAADYLHGVSGCSQNILVDWWAGAAFPAMQRAGATDSRQTAWCARFQVDAHQRGAFHLILTALTSRGGSMRQSGDLIGIGRQIETFCLQSLCWVTDPGKH
jgi:hypothetical protein